MISIRQQVELETVFFITLAALAGFYFVLKNNQNFNQQFRVTTPIIANENSTNVVSPVPLTPKVDIVSQLSPDGNKKVIMQTTTNKDASKTYEFSIVDMQTNVEKTIFTQTVDTNSSFSIPFNTFSPDDKYFFIQETKSEEQEYMVFETSGNAFNNGQNFLDVTSILTSKITAYTIDQVTGWASETLLIANTKKSDGSQGPSYWLDVPSKAVIPLATEF
ncbi:MAG TPA: hypothetical protein VF820_04725 [Patescibacteria group bacterium]